MNIDDIEIYEVPEKICVVRNWFSEEEIKQIMEELQLLCDSNIMLTAGRNDPFAAIDPKTGEPRKRGHGIFLPALVPMEQLYSRFINYKLSDKLYSDSFISMLEGKDSYFSRLRNTGLRSILVNYYENNDEYKLHHDADEFTAVIVLWKTPKKFEGGKLMFTENELDFNIDYNTLVLFPGKVVHGVTPIHTTEKLRRRDYSGRFSIVYFIDNNEANVNE